jgi:ribosome-binding factor A
MPREFTRKDRVSDALQRELSKLIRDEVRDPRLAMVNITAVEVNRDLANAKVFVTFVGSSSEQESQKDTEILNGAAGFLRARIARFIYDHSGKRGQDLTALIERSVYLDKQHQQNPDDLSLDSPEED